MPLCYFSLITSEIFWLRNRCRYHFVGGGGGGGGGGVLTNISSIKEINHHVTLVIPKRIKNVAFISIAPLHCDFEQK